MITMIPTFIVMGVGMIDDEKIRANELHSLYRELAEIVGEENMQKLYSHYKGQQINFPTKIYNMDYIRNLVRCEYDGTNVKELARRTGYSERWIRKLAKECKEHSAK